MLRRSVALAGWLAAFVTAALGCHQTRPEPHVATPAPVPKRAEPTPPSRELLNDLALVATGQLPTGSILALEEDTLAGRSSPAKFVDALLEAQEFSESVVPRVIMKHDDVLAAMPPRMGFPIREEAGVYYMSMHGKCDPKTAVKVHPWWAMDSEVSVCPTAYQPTHLKDAKGYSYCGGNTLNPADLTGKQKTFCGCGPNLINCMPRGYGDKMRSSLKAELSQTIGHVVKANQPVEQMFTMNETVRDGLADFFYTRWRVMSGEMASFEPRMPIDAPAQLAPRFESTPGQHAGVLTTQLVFVLDSGRPRMLAFYETLWCATTESIGVGAEKIFGLGTANLREGDGWKRLAAMPICTSCHARLDYGMQFFNGYLSHPRGMFYLPQEHSSGVGPLYARNIEDRVGEGPLTPNGFAKLAVSTPSFSRCMVQDVSNYVFSGAASPEDEAALAEAFAARHSMKDLMRTALLRYAAAASDSTLAEETAESAPPSARAELNEHCGSCHSSGARGFLELPTWTSAYALKIASHVSYGTMPPDGPLPRPLRRRIVDAVLHEAFPEPAKRAEARAFLALEPAAARRPEMLRSMIHTRAGYRPGSEEGLPFTDDALIPRFDDALAATLAYDALHACTSQGKVGDELKKCVESSAAIRGMVNDVALHR